MQNKTNGGRSGTVRRLRMAIVAGVLGAGLFGGAAGYLLYPDTPTEEAGLDPAGMYAPGGPFALTDHTGTAVTDKDYRGKFILIAFGYTFCPDICPTGLQGMSRAMDLLGEQADWVRPVFITIDPERDTPVALTNYVAAFHPKMIGLTGTPQQIARAAEVFHVRYVKSVPVKDATGDTSRGDDEDYSMSHTTAIYLVGTDGRGLAVFEAGMAAMEVEAMVDRIRHFINIQEALLRAR